MRSRQLFVIGIILCMIGAAYVDLLIARSIGKAPTGIKSIPGFAIVLLGGYFIYLSKKKQKE